jgi:hypothetical protein
MQIFRGDWSRDLSPSPFRELVSSIQRPRVERPDGGIDDWGYTVKESLELVAREGIIPRTQHLTQCRRKEVQRDDIDAEIPETFHKPPIVKSVGGKSVFFALE